MKTHELEVDSLLKSFNKAYILTDVYLKCVTNEVVGILGRNGSGKSTLLEIIFGTLDSENKSIRIDKKTYHIPFKEGNLIAYLSQDSFLPKNVLLGKLITLFIPDKQNQKRVRNDERVKEHLNKTSSDLSGGERRFFEVLLLMNLPAKFVLLDEPFAGIEPLYKEKIKELVNEYKKEKGFIITDHDYRNIIDASDRIILITSGVCKPINKLQQLEEYNYLPKGTISNAIRTNRNEEIIKEKAFIVDEQTLNDLELNNPAQPESLLAIFDSNGSKGGTSKLVQMLKSPVTNHSLLESRRDTIKYIQEKNFELNFDRKHIDFIEFYQYSGVTLSRKNSVDSFFNGIKNKYKPSNDYHIIKTGILHSVNFLENLSQLLQSTENKNLPNYLSELIYKIHDIITQREIRKVLYKIKHKGLLFYNLGSIDFLFRKTIKNKMMQLLDMYYEIEAYQVVAKTATKLDFNYPVYLSNSNPIINIKGLFHPKLTSVVSNDFNIKYTDNVCFLTGANMSGKSTFLKSFGIAMYFAHLGFPVPAQSLETTVFNGLITTINLSDNINKGFSHFYSEVKRVKEAATQVKKHNNMIVIFDELFRGTNVKDAADASLLITSAFANIQHSLFLVSTHIVEIADDLNNLPNVFFSCFDVRLENNTPIYNYKLKQGVSKESLGLFIVKKEGIVEILEKGNF
ncbi:MAG: ATP-binding cassette domain-containing protein [Cyclobacteriaceae bacterium]|nr:ATP-binding cassette domain-containing protein [Cyclobacteriaceae bacterium]